MRDEYLDVRRRMRDFWTEHAIGRAVPPLLRDDCFGKEAACWDAADALILNLRETGAMSDAQIDSIIGGYMDFRKKFDQAMYDQLVHLRPKLNG